MNHPRNPQAGDTDSLVAMSWVETNGRKPRTGERLLQIRFRNGLESKEAYTAGQMRWTQTGDDWDVVAVRRAG